MKDQTSAGIEVLGDIPWGTDVCHFYETKEDLLEILVPYFITGLENNEYCLWITSDPLDPRGAILALKNVVPELDQYISDHRIEILPYEEWYLKEGAFNLTSVIGGLQEKYIQSSNRGFSGMRLSGDTGWVDHTLKKTFFQYEREMDAMLHKNRMIALYTYPLHTSTASDVLDVAIMHETAIAKRKGRWEIVEVSERKGTRAHIQLQNEKLERRVESVIKELRDENEALRREIAERKSVEALLYTQEKESITERVKAEDQKLFEQREKEALINATDDMMWSVSRDFKLVAFNKAFIQGLELMTGVSFRPGDNLLVDEFFPAEMVTFWKETYSRALSGESFQIEYFMPATGQYPRTWSEASFNPIYQNDTVIGVACHSRDVTDRKLAEERIRQSEEHLSEAQRVAKLGSWSYDIQADKLIWSDELYNVFGTDKQTFNETHRSFLNLIDDEDREAAFLTSRHTQLTGEPFSIEYHITTPNGEKRLIREHGYGQSDGNGVVFRLFGTAQDITELKKSEINLKEAIVQLSLFKAIVNTSDDAIISRTLDGIITSWNRGAETIYGFNSKEAIGKSITMILPADLKSEEAGIIAKIKNGESVEHYETERLRKDGSRFSISLTISPVLDSNGNIVGASKIARDITERKKIEIELQQVNEELRMLSTHLQNVREEERIQIARNVHDELGQQLTGLKLDINWLKRKLDTEDEVIREKMNTITGLIDETLQSVRRISSDLRPSLLDDFGLIAALEWYSEEAAKRSEISINFTALMPEPEIPKDAQTGLFRIYQELLTNAVRHANARVITSSLQQKENHLLLTLKDDGQGIDPLMTGTKKTLGLIGIKERTFALGGKFDLKSSPGRGTEIQISIPL